MVSHLPKLSGDYTVSAKIGRGLTIDGDKAIAITLSDTLDFEGTVNLTSATVVDTASANDGDTYFNVGDGTVSTEWAAISDLSAGDLVEPRSSVTWDTGDSEFKYLPAAKAVELWSTASGKLYPTSISSDVLVGGANTTDAKIQLNTDGAIRNTSIVKTTSLSGFVAQSTDPGAQFAFRADDPDGDTNVTIYTDGSATFAGTLNAGKVGSDTQTIITNDGIIYNGNTGGNFRNVINGTNGNASFASTVTTGALRCFDAAETVRFKSARTSGDIFTLWNGATSVNDGTKVASIQGDGSASFAGLVRSDRFTTKSGISMQLGGTDYAFAAYQDSTSPLATIGVDGTATFAGNVGIGENNPGNKLSVKQSAVDNAPDRSSALYLQNNGNCEIQMVGNSTNNVQLRMGTSGNSFVGALDYSLANNRLDFYTNSTRQVTIDSSGNVGIGTDSPGEKLEVNGTSVFRSGIHVSAGNYAWTGSGLPTTYIGENRIDLYKRDDDTSTPFLSCNPINTADNTLKPLVAKIDPDGSASFAGKVTAGSYDLESLPKLGDL